MLCPDMKPVCIQVFLTAAALLAGGCASTAEFAALPPSTANQRIPFLSDGITTKAECLARLGYPSIDDQANTLVYEVYGSANGAVSQLRSSGDLEGADRRYDLVLTFDAQGILRRHTLVQKPGKSTS
jgi:hypothetical protein